MNNKDRTLLTITRQATVMILKNSGAGRRLINKRSENQSKPQADLKELMSDSGYGYFRSWYSTLHAVFLERIY